MLARVDRKKKEHNNWRKKKLSSKETAKYFDFRGGKLPLKIGIYDSFFSTKEHTFTLRQSYLWIIPNILSNCLLYSCIRFT